MNEDLREWLGIAKADFIFYSALLTSIIACFFDRLLIISILFAISIAICIYSMVIGMPAKEELSKATNIAKKITYPLGLALILSIVAIKYLIIFYFEDIIGGLNLY